MVNRNSCWDTSPNGMKSLAVQNLITTLGVVYSPCDRLTDIQSVLVSENLMRNSWNSRTWETLEPVLRPSAGGWFHRMVLRNEAKFLPRILDITLLSLCVVTGVSFLFFFAASYVRLPSHRKQLERIALNAEFWVHPDKSSRLCRSFDLDCRCPVKNNPLHGSAKVIPIAPHTHVRQSRL